VKLGCFGQGADASFLDANPLPRNIQFELVAGAYFVLGGADLRPEEPDYTLLYHGRRVGLAVKRLTSLSANTLKTRLREAADQLLASSLEGFAVVNLDGWLTDLSADSSDDIGVMFVEQLRDAYRPIQRVVRSRHALRGVLIFGTWVRCVRVGKQRQLLWKSPFQFLGFGENTTENEAFLEYFSTLRLRWEASFRELADLLQPAA
jgi:hypothetical protein